MSVGPNVKKLIGHKMALQMIPPGTDNPLRAGFEGVMAPGALAAHAKEAVAWVQAALAAIKTAPENPFGDDDEAIAGELLRRIDERKQQYRRH